MEYYDRRPRQPRPPYPPPIPVPYQDGYEDDTDFKA